MAHPARKNPGGAGHKNTKAAKMFGVYGAVVAIFSK